MTNPMTDAEMLANIEEVLRRLADEPKPYFSASIIMLEMVRDSFRVRVEAEKNLPNFMDCFCDVNTGPMPFCMKYGCQGKRK